jgi:quinol monooxygenase YgiN
MKHELLRLFQSAVDPSDVDAVRKLFTDDVAPAFRHLDGCLSIELIIGFETNAGGLVDGAAISRWSSREAMEKALASREAREGLVRILGLLRQEPVTRLFEVVA